MVEVRSDEQIVEENENKPMLLRKLGVTQTIPFYTM